MREKEQMNTIGQRAKGHCGQKTNVDKIAAFLSCCNNP